MLLQDKEAFLLISELQQQAKSVVFTNGCFDILHVGHVRLLQQAKALGDFLIVAINTDDSVKRLKGKSRPINILDDRIEMLGALKYVDAVVSFSEDTPYRLLGYLKPDILVKGGDYTEAQVVGRRLVKRVVILPYIENISTTILAKSKQVN